MNLLVLTFYKFVKIAADQVPALQETLEKRGEELGLRGLMIFGTEGCNCTLSGEEAPARQYLEDVKRILGVDELAVKESWVSFHPFRLFKVKVREEIVTLGKPDVLPYSHSATHLPPEEWQRVMQEEDVIVLDTRNWYETKVGKFKGALDPEIEEFHDFPEYLKKTALPKDKKILIYCTGGIRCEKAVVEMNNQGYENVYQLEGGILNYLTKFPNQNFEGECFVFDHRVAVDQNLQPSQQFKMCPHCGQPAQTVIDCVKCESKAVVCDKCLKEDAHHTCSKNCTYHYRLNPGSKGRKQEQGYRWEITQVAQKP